MMNTNPRPRTRHNRQQTDARQEWPYTMTDERFAALTDELNINALVSVLYHIQRRRAKAIALIRQEAGR